MAHINEPKGLDFLIKSPPLTDIERIEISELIKKLKQDKNIKKRKIVSRRKQREKA